MTLSKADGGWSSKDEPQVAPALAKRMSRCSVVLRTSSTSRSISDILDRSAGTEMAVAPGRLEGMAFSAAHASSHAFALREVM